MKLSDVLDAEDRETCGKRGDVQTEAIPFGDTEKDELILP